jgi:hypothetical protein
MPHIKRYTIWTHDRQASTRGQFPVRGQTEDEVLARLVDLPAWSDSVFVFDDRTGRQVFLAFVDRQTSQQQQRVVLDVLVVPDSWVGPLAGRPRETTIPDRGRQGGSGPPGEDR